MDFLQAFFGEFAGKSPNLYHWRRIKEGLLPVIVKNAEIEFFAENCKKMIDKLLGEEYTISVS